MAETRDKRREGGSKLINAADDWLTEAGTDGSTIGPWRGCGVCVEHG